MDSRLQRFKQRLEGEVLRHPVIVANPYTRWFAQGTFTREQARAFLIQFSVFSNEFLVAQLRKVLNADTLQEMRASKEILANEIGVGFRSGMTRDNSVLGSIDGSIEGGTFHFRAAHFELLVRMARQFGLAFGDLGKRHHGSESTLEFCDELIRLYGHADYQIGAAASWAVENWAAAGFWDDLVRGWRRYASREGTPRMDIAFFSWHARLEANHARHTWAELEDFYESASMDEDAFIGYANEMLDGVMIFWRGLDEQRRSFSEETAGVSTG